MPGPTASRLTRQHQRDLHAVGRAVAAPVHNLARKATVADIDGWFERVLARIVASVRAGWLAARRDTDEYLRAHARAEGRAVVPQSAVWVPERVVASARVTGPVAFKKHIAAGGSEIDARRLMARTLPAAAQRLAYAGGRETVEATVKESDVILGWRRVTDGDPCAFCALLASRGAVFLSEKSATTVVGRRGVARGNRAVGESYHDGCGCIAEPLYEHEDEPPSVLDLQEQWRTATAGTSGKSAIRAWRRHWDQQKKDGG